MGDQRTVLNRGGLLMKKAYVKPVFLAEEFVAASSYAVGTCGPGTISQPWVINKGDLICNKNGKADNGHKVGQNKQCGLDDAYTYDTNITNWGYAEKGDNQVTLFASKLCDFLWNPAGGNTDEVSVWNQDRTESKVVWWTGILAFLAGPSPSEEKHTIAYEGQHTPLS